MSGFMDLTGQRFGSLVALSRAQDTYDKCGTVRVQWKCKCDCGKTKTVKTRYLRRGSSRSCGSCNKKELDQDYE